MFVVHLTSTYKKSTYHCTAVLLLSVYKFFVGQAWVGHVPDESVSVSVNNNQITVVEWRPTWYRPQQGHKIYYTATNTEGSHQSTTSNLDSLLMVQDPQ